MRIMLKTIPNVDYVLDGGNTTVGIESTIVSIEGDTVNFITSGFYNIGRHWKCSTDTFFSIV